MMEQNKETNQHQCTCNTHSVYPNYGELREQLEKNVVMKVAMYTGIFVAVVAAIALINGVIVAFELLPLLIMMGLM